ncbi:MAG: Omp28 family outer membrane lipoprotein [Bacteroidales bacterium]|nr:Omp28 family outer membrane lipoprotein [Bacteroidales bacterium]
MKPIKILSVLLLVILFSCDTIDNPLKDTDGKTCGDENGPIPIRKILIEDYTGHKCPNCPDAARIIEELSGTYCDHIIPIGIHVGYFAEPDEDFPADYTTETGDQLDNFFKVANQGLPNGLINRSEYDGSIVIGRNNWAAAVDLLYNLNPEVNIVIESSYNESTHKVTATISAEFLSKIDYNINLGLYVTEDSIISPQKDGSATIEDYVHRHVLRKGINGAFGENFASTGSFGDIIEKTFTFTADPEWVIENCELIAFISKSSSNEIIQAESEHIDQE